VRGLGPTADGPALRVRKWRLRDSTPLPQAYVHVVISGAGPLMRMVDQRPTLPRLGSTQRNDQIAFDEVG
jgi:hypothetical protein